MPRCRLIDAETGYIISVFYNPRLRRHIVVLRERRPPRRRIPPRIIRWLKGIYVYAALHFSYCAIRNKELRVEAFAQTFIPSELIDQVMTYDCALRNFIDRVWDKMEVLLKDIVADLFNDTIARMSDVGFGVASIPAGNREAEDYPNCYVIAQRDRCDGNWKVIYEGVERL